MTKLRRNESTRPLLKKYLKLAKGEAQLLYAENLRVPYLRKKGLGQLARPEVLKSLQV